MTVLLDTTVLSNQFLPRPNPGVESWVLAQAGTQTFTSVVCFGELWRGLLGFPPGARSSRFDEWLVRVASGEGNLRLLPIDLEVATRWGAMVHDLERAGRRPPVADSLIAATALVHNLTVVTRNTADFERCGVPTLNPWT